MPLYASPRVTQTLRGKLLRLASAAASSNPLINPPLAAPAAWAISTAYYKGQVVTANGSQYLCRVAGTSASSGTGPSVTTTASVTDGSASWQYFGASTITGNNALAPAVSQTGSTPAGLTTQFNAVSSPGLFKFCGGVPAAYAGGATYNFAAAAISASQSGNVTGHLSNNSWSVHFHVDAAKFAIGFSNNNTATVRVVIDGQYYALSAFQLLNNNPNWIVFDFTAAGGKKPRKVIVESGLNLGFWGVRVSPIDLVWAPPGQDDLRWYWFGDSILTGGNGYPSIFGLDTPTQAGKLLGVNDVWDGGISGTGYVAQGSGNNYYNFGQHLSDATANAPNLVAFAGSINDNGQAASAITAAALACFQATRAALPSVPIIVFGVWPGATGPSAGLIATEAAVQAAVTQSGDALTQFIPIASDPSGAWLTGTGNGASPSGAGNADFHLGSDGTHPCDLGIAYLAHRKARAFRNLLGSWAALDRIAV